MLLTILIGWTILLPAVVIVGLYLSSAMLARRARQRGGYRALGSLVPVAPVAPAEVRSLDDELAELALSETALAERQPANAGY